MSITSPIFDAMYSYPCYIPYIATLPAEEIEEYGLRSTGVEELDEHLDTQPTRVYITIDRMIDLYVSNYKIRIADATTAKTVYESIVAYTAQWASYIKSNSMNKSTAPIDDLLMMEEFASKLRPFAVDGVMGAPPEIGLTNLLDDYFSPIQRISIDHSSELLDLFRDYKKRMGG